MAGSPLDFTTQYTYDHYDSESRLTYAHVTDPQGYDALGRLVQSDALQQVTTYTYQYGLLQAITDANGNRTAYGYGASRNLLTTSSPDGAVETYGYSASGGLNRISLVTRLFAPPVEYAVDESRPNPVTVGHSFAIDSRTSPAITYFFHL